MTSDITESQFFSGDVQPQLKMWGDYQRIENASGSGVPDVNYAIEGHHGWLELKVAKNGKLYFEKFQLPWMRRRSRHMHDIWVLAKVGEDVCLYHAKNVVEAPCHVEGKWTVVNVSDLTPIVFGPRPWGQVLNTLTQRHPATSRLPQLPL